MPKFVLVHLPLSLHDNEEIFGSARSDLHLQNSPYYLPNPTNEWPVSTELALSNEELHMRLFRFAGLQYLWSRIVHQKPYSSNALVICIFDASMVDLVYLYLKMSDIVNSSLYIDRDYSIANLLETVSSIC